MYATLEATDPAYLYHLLDPIAPFPAVHVDTTKGKRSSLID